MSLTAKEVRNAYMREYRKANREKILKQEKERRIANPERFKKYREDYWNRKAESTRSAAEPDTMEGIIEYYNKEKGYGFIDQGENKDNIFFHVSNFEGIPRMDMRVRYNVFEGKKGIEAENIIPLSD